MTLAFIVAPALPLGLYWAVLRRENDRAAALRVALIALAVVAVWMAMSYGAAASGLLEFGPLPPRLAFVLIPMLIAIIVFSRSRLGKRLATGVPLAALVGVQGFRLPLEMIMHRAYSEGVMPLQWTRHSFGCLHYSWATRCWATCWSSRISK